MFLILMVVGLAGLAMMAVPAFGKHGGAIRGGHALHAANVAKLAPIQAASAALTQAGATAGAGHLAQPDASTALVPQHGASLLRFVPSPRLVFSLLALYGAFGNALLRAVHLAPAWAALAAILPAAAVERFVVTPVWRLMFRFQGQPSRPLAEIVLSEATAVTAFRNGRGIVSVIRDGRSVQFSARLIDAQLSQPIRVGDRLRVEDLDPKRERLTVSVFGE